MAEGTPLSYYAILIFSFFQYFVHAAFTYLLTYLWLSLYAQRRIPILDHDVTRKFVSLSVNVQWSLRLTPTVSDFKPKQLDSKKPRRMMDNVLLSRT